MLESLAAWVLNTYVGEYLENLNTDQLSIALLQGAVELENLPFKKDALKSLDLPLEIKGGFIGRITLQIPVRRLRSEPWVILMEKVYLVAGPLQKQEYDDAREKLSEQAQKQKLLQALEAKWQIQSQGKQEGASWFSYGTSMASNILENLQLNVKDVHIRYEDDVISPMYPFACGVVIKSLSAQSTDANWIPKFVSRAGADMMYKLVDLQNFSVYWDLDASMVGDLPMDELSDAMQREMYSCQSSGQFAEHDYILAPVSAQAHMQRNTSSLPLRTAAMPRVTLSIDLDDMSFSLSEPQYRGLLQWLKEFERHGRRRRFMKWRPSDSVKTNPIKWWKYAIFSHLDIIQQKHERHTKDFMLQRAKDVVKYYNAYKLYLSQGTLDYYTKVNKEKLEADFSFEELKIIRELVFQRLKQEGETKSTDAVANPTYPPEQGKSMFQRWFPGWGGWSGGSSYQAPEPYPTVGESNIDDDTGEPPVKLSKSDITVEKEILDVIQDSAEDNSLLRRDVVFAKLNFNLNSGSFRLLTCAVDTSPRSPRSPTLPKASLTMLELQCDAINMMFESRPRTSSLKFGVTVGGLYLHDKMTDDSLFPCLVGPQTRDRYFGQKYSSISGKMSGSKLMKQKNVTPDDKSEDEKFFHLIYERNPADSNADYRVSIQTKPLDIIYSPAAASRVTEFFSNTAKLGGHVRMAELKLAAAAKSRYEALKNQTRAELKQTFDHLLEGEQEEHSKRWEISLDISAPQVIIPDSFSNPKATLVVVNLGHLKFHNTSPEIWNQVTSTPEEKDAFHTPSSTPPDKSADRNPRLPSRDSSSDTLTRSIDPSERMYDKYAVELSDLQVLVGSVKESWKNAQSRSTSKFHVLDRFSIALQLERRLCYSSDPNLPSVAISGTMPKLTVHINEQKVQALQICVDILSGRTAASQSSTSLSSVVSESPSGTYQTWDEEPLIADSSAAGHLEQQMKEVLESSKQLMMQFSIHQMSLEVQSRQRSVAELQVAGVRANFTKRPYDSSVSLTVQSLLIVDALQTYGRDFELLVASHKNVSLQPHSGMYRDSNAASPTSPQSPMETEPQPTSPSTFQSVQDAVTNAFQSVMNTRKSRLSSSSSETLLESTSSSSGNLLASTSSSSGTLLASNSSSNGTLVPSGSASGMLVPSASSSGIFVSSASSSVIPVSSASSSVIPVPSASSSVISVPSAVPSFHSFSSLDSEALILLELELISPNAPSNVPGNEALQIATIHFNSLDITANQETVMELVGFFNRVFPSSSTTLKRTDVSAATDVTQNAASSEDSLLEVDTKTELTAEFQRINILLMRLETDKEGKRTAEKVATATMTSARIKATIASDIQVDGSLGGFHVINLSPDDERHKHVISVGQDFETPSPSILQPSFQPTDMFKTANESMFMDYYDSESKALTFSLIKPRKQNVSTASSSPAKLAESKIYQDPRVANVVKVNLHMASLLYTHTPKFLHQLSQCITEFKDYTTTVASSLKNAASEVAKGMVNKRQGDAMGKSFLGGSLSNFDQVPPFKMRRDFSLSDLGDSVLLDNASEFFACNESGSDMTILLHAKLETPLIVLPRTATSSEVLVANLGQITIRNQESLDVTDDSFTFSPDNQFNDDKIYIDIRNMNLSSVDMNKLPNARGDPINRNQASSVYTRMSAGVPIIYNTNIDLIVNRVEADWTVINPSDTHLGGDLFPKPKTSLEVQDAQDVVDVSAIISTPLKLVLSKNVYEQLLQTVDNLTYTENDFKEASSDSPPKIKVEKSDSKSRMTDREKGISPLPDMTNRLAVKPKPAKVEDRYTITRVKFEVPVFNVELKGDFGDGEQGMVDLKLFEFVINYEKNNPHTTSFDLALKSLEMDDLLESPTSSHRRLMVSSSKKEETNALRPKYFLSTSCPDSTIVIPTPVMPHSLPSSFHKEKPFVRRGNKRQSSSPRAMPKEKASSKECPCTPPPSPQLSRRDSLETTSKDNLVHIKVMLVEKKSPDYSTKHNRTNRFIDIDFNCLDTTINLQTWVVLLDFLGMGAKVHDERNLGDSGMFVNAMPTKQDEVINSEINLNVESLTLILNRPDYELAKANISGWNSHLSLRDDNMAMTGSLKRISLLDQSPSGDRYRERFITVGTQVLEFDFFKYGLPDPLLQREYDLSLTLQMASVCYLHTQRFMSETIAFCQHFLQLQELMGRSQAALGGKQISETAKRGARIKMNVEINSPVILIPHSSRTTEVLVANLGNLKITNCFLADNSDGTIRAKQSLIKSRKRLVTKNNSSSSLAAAKEPERVNPMTQSLFDEFVPPRFGLDPMTQGVYGSLNADLQAAVPPSTLLPDEVEVFDIVDDGTSVDPWPSNLSSTSSFSSDLDERLNDSPLRKKGSSKDRQMQYADNLTPKTSEACVSVSFDSSTHKCLLDVMDIVLSDMHLFSARRVEKKNYTGNNLNQDVEFPSCVFQREGGRLLKETCVLSLQVERNLEGDLSHSAPDWRVSGALSSVHCSIDVEQYKLIRGFLDHNLGEQLEVFQTPVLSNLQDPKNYTVLSGTVYKCNSIVIELHNVVIELLESHQHQSNPEVSLAKLKLIRSRLSYDSFSDQSKDVDLVSHEIVATDTRYTDAPVNARPNVFVNVLEPSKSRSNTDCLQLELHYRSTKDFTKFTVLLNNMKLMCVFDWLISLKEFLGSNAENPFKNEAKKAEYRDVARTPSGGSISTPLHMRNRSPLTTSGGITTKRGPVVEQVEVPFEVKLNVTNSEFVLIEDSTMFDTNAVILKCTAVMAYRPKANDRPLTCSLQSLEVFSCCLVAEEETALSIIDPMTISIELNANPIPELQTSMSAGLLDATSLASDPPLLLEVSFNTMNIRLSYHDINMFMAILNSLPKQALEATSKTMATKHSAQSLDALHEMGFSRPDCEVALTRSAGSVSEAALWLTKNAKPVPPEVKPDEMKITGVELKATGISVCLIDDCMDADVPLAEISFNGVYFYQKLHPHQRGNAMFQLVGDYYNRSLSGWEPLIEAWRCHAKWIKKAENGEDKLALEITASEVLNLTITTAMLDQYNKTKDTWTEDYLTQTAADRSRDSMADNKPSSYLSVIPSSLSYRRRVPFIPFIIRNQTGCMFWFLTVTTNPSVVPSDGVGDISSTTSSSDSAYIQASDWKRIGPDEDLPFFFGGREKIRHKKTHELRVKQLVVKVDGWQRVSPVTVDKVGVYFRHAKPELRSAQDAVITVHPARIVFDVRHEGSARKVIIVRSALSFVNNLSGPVHIKLENSTDTGEFTKVQVAPNETVPLPLAHVSARLWVKPADWPTSYCNKPIHWQHVMRASEISDGMRTCLINETQAAYRFCVAVKRENYPEEALPKKGQSQGSICFMPGHTITVVSPVVIHNLLPVELNYYLKGTAILGTIKPGQKSSLHSADLSQPMELGITLENYMHCRELVVPPGTSRYRVKLRLYDTQGRLLELIVRISARKGGSIKFSVSCPYWLINKSGLPMIFKQDGTRQEAAGQFEEHELARSVVPLLFSFTDKEYAQYCTMRAGKSVHGPNAYTHWCTKFSLESGVGFRQLHVSSRRDNRPDWLVVLYRYARARLSLSVKHILQVYNLGIEVRQGRGNYRDTNFVKFAPCYEIDNRSKNKLAIAQRHLTQGQAIPNLDNHLTALPLCRLPFHWPRMDLDQLLCVKLLDHPSCHWSGGFRIDRVDSFHVNVRAQDRSCFLLKVEIVLQGPTFFIVFSDSEQMPPPFRIDNFSEVPLLYYQTKVADDRLRTYIKPHVSLPYAWDEPMLDHYITLSVHGGTSATYSMDVLGEGDQLCYENFIFLAATATFRRPGFAISLDDKVAELETKELVLDCVQSDTILFKRKELGKRSQLWRMTSNGMLEHEGSVPPKDLRKPATPHSNALVLDIADLAIRPEMRVPLILKKPDPRRTLEQIWTFTPDGRICCGTGNCIQAVCDFTGLHDGAMAMLGPSVTVGEEVPVYQRVSRQKLRPGSGCLSVKVHMDGPTRVLQITDINHRELARPSNMPVYNEFGKSTSQEANKEDKTMNLELSLHLKNGVGISIVNAVPEELAYVSMQGILLDYVSTSSMLTLDLCVGNIQVDNQLFGTMRPVVLFITPTSKRDVPDNTPALHIAAHKIPNSKWNADIYKHLVISMKKLTLQLEERFLWKVLQFAGYNQTDAELDRLEQSELDMQKAVSAATSVQTKRYYFGMLKINGSRVTLSMLTASKLSPDLEAIKNSLAIPLVKFEDAKVDVDPFVQHHPFETKAFLFNEIMRHYSMELKSQAAKILGSVDFLGNPLGLFNDVTEGISGLIKDGNVGGLLKSVTYGVSNSAAKVTGALSDGLGTVSMDDRHQAMREQIKAVHSGSSSDHLVAGIKGLGYGLFSGVTGIFRQPYEGLKRDGVEGFISGVGKGVIGTVTKPVAGVLDFASGAASAVRDTSRSSLRNSPPRCRLPRCCHGPGGVLPQYSKSHAAAQSFLYDLNEHKFDELFIALEQLRQGKEDSLRALITSQQVYFLRRGGPDMDNVVLRVVYEDLIHCRNIENNGRQYVELTMKADSSANMQGQLKRPQVRCDKQSISQKVAQQIMYAKCLHDERLHTLAVDVSLTMDE